MKFTEQEIDRMVAEEGGEGEACARLGEVIKDLLGELRAANKALADLAGREAKTPVVNVAASAAPQVSVAAAATPKIEVNVAPNVPRVVNFTVVEREKDGPNQGMLKRGRFEVWEEKR